MSSFSATLEQDLKSRVKGNCFFDLPSRKEYSSDESWYRIIPVAVVQPRDAEDVQSVVEYCHEREIPIIPRGGATGLAGQAIGLGIILDFSKHMTGIFDITPDSVRVEPGVVLAALNEKLDATDRFFPIDPASGNRCTIGGMIGTNAAGAHGIKYGAMKQTVKELKVVLSTGEIAILGEADSPAPSAGPFYDSIVSELTPLLSGNRDLIHQRYPDVLKNSSGYNLHDALTATGIDFRKILIGSEGTLGIVVESSLRISPRPAHRTGALAYFDTEEKAVDATILGLEHDPSAIEILDDTYVSLVKGMHPEFDALILDGARAMLYFEFEGDSPDDLSRSLMQLNRSLTLTPPMKFMPLVKKEELRTVWRLREEASSIINSQKSRGKTSFVEDVAVPLRSLPAYVRGLTDILRRNGIGFSIYGHAGVGNIHCATFVDLKNLEHYKVVDRIASEVYALARSLGGTHSGEHGDGLIRTPFLEDLYGPEIYALFGKVKDAFDPRGILNPGKIIGQQSASILHDLIIQ
ncbi:MAG: FAD-binding oxidoreductase [Ignavibacteriales bacterium]|nr:FAD-binding oxidoreductase [Ignavibacteriales bacterium]